jgi:hypothetical protein
MGGVGVDCNRDLQAHRLRHIALGSNMDDELWLRRIKLAPAREGGGIPTGDGASRG